MQNNSGARMKIINQVYEEGKEFIIKLYSNEVKVVCEEKLQRANSSQGQKKGFVRSVRVIDKNSELYQFTSFITTWEVVAEC